MAGQKLPKFTKEALVASIRFREYKDLLEALLEDDKEYTTDEVDKLINDFKEKEV